MARKALLQTGRFSLDEKPEGFDETVADLLLRPHLCYRKPIETLTAGRLASGFAHITGGGLIDIVPRILPDSCTARIDRRAWRPPPLFRLIAETGSIQEQEMYRVFNMGIGLVAVVPGGREEDAIHALAAGGHRAFRIGVVEEGTDGVNLV